MNTDVHLGNQTIGNAVNFFEHSLAGLGDVQFFGEQFSSATQLLNHTQPLGNESVVHFLTGDTLSINLPKKKFGAVIRSIADYFNFPQ